MFLLQKNVILAFLQQKDGFQYRDVYRRKAIRKIANSVSQRGHIKAPQGDILGSCGSGPFVCPQDPDPHHKVGSRIRGQ